MSAHISPALSRDRPGHHISHTNFAVDGSRTVDLRNAAPLPLEIQSGRSLSAHGASDLQHRPSAKQLISRYEQMNPNEPAYERRTLSVPRTLASLDTQASHLLKSTKEKTAPLRQSFRNLVSVIKKGRAEQKAKPVPRRVSCSQDQHTGHEPSAVAQLEAPDVHISSSRVNSRPHSGRVLYLSHAPDSRFALTSVILPVWTSCVASLENDHILITWTTTHGNPSTHKILLASLADVRSLAMNEMDQDEKALLPSQADEEELKIFEILFEGRAREKFAVDTVQERARWVAAIWDMVLALQEKRISAKTPKLGSGYDSPAERLARDTTYQSERELPPTPNNKKHPRLRRESRLLQDLPRIPQLSPIVEFSPPQTSSKSISIANLNQISVVKQRLAQIERASSGGERVLADTRASGLKASGLGNTLQCRSSVRSTASDTYSILDSYGDVSSPIPEISAENPTALMSPASQYSIETIMPARLVAQASVAKALPDVPECLDLPPGGSSVAALDAVRGTVQRISRRTEETKAALGQVCQKLHLMHDDIQRGASAHPSYEKEVLLILQIVEEMRQQLGLHLPEMLKKLGSTDASAARNPMAQDELALVHSKLDNLLYIFNREKAGCPSTTLTSDLRDHDLAKAEISRLLALLESSCCQHSVQVQQQTESTRYLRDLNSWLEAFVENGPAQIQAVMSDVQRLRQELGSPTTPMGSDSSGGVLSEIRQLLSRLVAREESAGQLQGAVDRLAPINVGSPDGSILGNTIQNLLDHQHQHIERMLRSLADELSNEIRGERLRFIDAMREATTINVLDQVEDMKRKLVTEMLHMPTTLEGSQRPQPSSSHSHDGRVYHFTEQQLLSDAEPPRPFGPRRVLHSAAPSIRTTTRRTLPPAHHRR